MQFFRELGDDFARNTQEKILGFREYCGKRLGWEETHGISSFVLRFATAEIFKRQSPSRFNQKTLEKVVEQLNQWIVEKKFQDPYTKELHPLKGSKINMEDVMLVFAKM
mmetsp:Transcript_29261/g.41192  ORF Transcript_29261/g.41192 Transcript_29261/m.41192 type:complete len:109 (+) Transcript_29261:320-646(+)